MLKPSMFCLLAALAVSSGTLQAQSSNASLSGVVLDPAGAVIPAAQVTLVSLGTGMASRTQTAGDGSYSFPSAPAGQYELKASARGFKDFRQQGIQLSLFEKARVEVRLEIGSSTETVEVRADASMVNFETAEQRGGIAPETVGELPLVVSNGVRSSAGFLTLLPGSSAPTGDVGSARINGGVQYAGEAILNGSALLNPAGQQGIISAAMDFAQSPDMVSELKVLQANYEPQYGSTGGAIIIMETKSGTNKFHGTAFEFLRNTAMNARQFNVAQRPKDIENDFGVSIGGPMKLPVATSKFNKTYFFFNWEGFRQRGAPTRPTLTIPSLKQRQGDFSDWVDVTGKLIPVYDPATSRVINGVTVRDQFMGCDGRSPNVICPARFANALALQWVKFLPQPTSSTPTNNFIPTGNGSNWTASANIYNMRVDEYLGSKDHITATVYRRDQPTYTESRLPEQISNDTDVYKYTWSNHLNWDHVFSPTLMFHFSGGYSHDYYQEGAHNYKFGDALPKIKGVPSNSYPPVVNFGDGYQTLGSALGSPANGKWPGPALSQNELVTWVHGKHTWKFGFEYRNQRVAPQNSSGEAGSFSFSALNTGLVGVNSGNSFASFLLDQVSSASVSYWPYGTTSARWGSWIAHVGDTWRVAPKVSLNLGLRWDLQEPTVEQHDIFSFFDAGGPNPSAGGRPGRMVFAGTRWGQASYGKRYPEERFVKGFGPRVGLAYSLDRNTVIRTGYGIFYDAGYYSGYAGGIQATGFNQTYSFSGSADGLSPAFLLSNGVPAITTPLPPFLDPGFANGQNAPIYRPKDGNRKPYTQQFNFGLERQFFSDLFVGASYVGTKGTRLLSRLAPLNAIDPQLLKQYGAKLNDTFQPGMTSLDGVPAPYTGWIEQMKACKPTVGQALLPYPQYCNSIQGVNEMAGNSNYHSLQIKIEKRFSKGLWVLTSYTLSKLLTDTESNQPGGTGFSPYERRRAKSISNADVPQAFSTAFVYDLPVGTGRRFLAGNRALDALVGGWRLSGVVRWNSGTPFSVRSGTCTVPAQIRVSCIPGEIPGIDPFLQDKSQIDVTKPLLNVKAFEPASVFAYYYGVGPRVDHIRGFAYKNVDATLMKNFRLREGTAFQIRGDAFNVFNLHTLRGFNTSVNSPAFGTWNGGVTSPRYLQIGGRLSF